MSSLDDVCSRLLETESRKTLDDSLYKNAENASGAGLEVSVTRTYDGVGLSGNRICQWCLDRCGVDMTLQEAYSIGAFERHPGCGCVIEYTSKRGQKTIQTGKYSGWSFPEELEKRKSIGLDEDFFADELMSRVKDYLGADIEAIIEEAENGGRHNGFYQQADRKTKPQLEKSIKSHIKEAELHEWKIQHPERYMERDDPNNPKDRERAIKKWESDRRRNSQQAGIEIEIWRKKYG